jgi:transcriptional regulator with XRE-family HTH domain
MPQRRDDDIARAFGQRLRDARRRAGLTQGQHAAEAGTTRDAIHKLENGHRNARVDTAVLLAAGLRIDPGELLKGMKP